MKYWLMKSEPDEFSIDDLAASPKGRAPWTGIRNYQARNFMRDDMRVGDQAFFYNSSCPEPGIAGVIQICAPAYPDQTQFDARSEYFDSKSTPDTPRWLHVDVEFVRKMRLIGLAQMRDHLALADMRLLQRGNRLSITPVSAAEWKYILRLE